MNRRKKQIKAMNKIIAKKQAHIAFVVAFNKVFEKTLEAHAKIMEIIKPIRYLGW